ncbi:MAG: amino acid ABC transporter substrate-binding protein [Oceanospirillaceae bacterium]|nr:amino acid ABC transporter substrate-binding protein [Oceanospirillaceae bacterium]
MYRLILGVFLCFTSQFSYGACNLSVRVTDYQPQYYQDSNAQWQGLAVEIAEALFKQAKCDITYVKLPWKRAIFLLERGGLDLLLNMTITAPREQFTHFIGPMMDEIQVLTVAKNSHLKINTLDDIKQLNKRIGIDRGVFYGPEFALKIKTDSSFTKKFEYADNSSNMAKLSAGRVLGIISSHYAAVYRIKNVLAKGQFKLHPFYFHKTLVHLGFSKKTVSKELLRRFQQAFDVINKNGVLLKIQQKYQ